MESGSVEDPLTQDGSRVSDEVLLQAATRTILAELTGWSGKRVGQDPAGVLESAIQKFLSSGKIRGKKKRLTVRAMAILLDEVPDTHEHRDDLTSRIQGLLERAG